ESIAARSPPPGIPPVHPDPGASMLCSHGRETPAHQRYDDFIMPLSQSQRPLYEVKANLFKGLAHPVRIRILELLAASPPVIVAGLQSVVGLSASPLSQLLSVPCRHHLVASERRGSPVFYRLADARIAELLAVAGAMLLSMLSADAERLSEAQGPPEIQGTPR